MDRPPTVEVFNFRAFDFRAGEARLSKYKASRDVVADLRGEVLEGTSEDVSPADLDKRGRFRRIPIGWDRLP